MNLSTKLNASLAILIL